MNNGTSTHPADFDPQTTMVRIESACDALGSHTKSCICEGTRRVGGWIPVAVLADLLNKARAAVVDRAADRGSDTVCRALAQLQLLEAKMDREDEAIPTQLTNAIFLLREAVSAQIGARR